MVTPLPPPVGGIGTWAETLLSSSLSEQVEVQVLDTSPSASGALKGGNPLRPRRIAGSLTCLWRALLQLRAFRPDRVHVNSSYYWGFLRDGAIVWLAKRFGAQALMQLHGGDFDVFMQR